MNLYFWLFALYALLIIPVDIRIHVRYEKGLYYRFRISAAGLAVTKKQKDAAHQAENRFQPGSLLRGMKKGDVSVWTALIRQGHIGRTVRLFRWHDIQIRAHISCEDAAQTAMLYALARTVLQTAAHFRKLPVTGRVEMDFEGRGSQFSLRCMTSVRLGILMAAAMRLYLAAAREKAKRLAPEEELYAASH